MCTQKKIVERFCARRNLQKNDASSHGAIRAVTWRATLADVGAASRILLRARCFHRCGCTFARGRCGRATCCCSSASRHAGWVVPDGGRALGRLSPFPPPPVGQHPRCATRAVSCCVARHTPPPTPTPSRSPFPFPPFWWIEAVWIAHVFFMFVVTIKRKLQCRQEEEEEHHHHLRRCDHGK